MYDDQDQRSRGKKSGHTLWEKWTGKTDDDTPIPTEQTINNPLKASLGDRVSLEYTVLEEELRHTPALEEILGVVREIRVYLKEISGQEVVRYRLKDAEGLSSDIWLEAMPSPEDPKIMEYALFEILDEMGYDEGFDDALGLEELFIPDQDGSEEVEGDTGDFYMRSIDTDDEKVRGLDALVASIVDSDKPPIKAEIAYWDYEREVMENAWIYVVVEMVEEGDNRGLTTILRGISIPETSIMLMPVSKG